MVKNETYTANDSGTQENVRKRNYKKLPENILN
jgi:hypothetical protein